MRRLGFVLFIVGLFFVIFSAGQFYVTSIIAENRMIPGVETALPWYLLPAGVGLLTMVLGLCLRLLGPPPRQ